MKKLLKNIFSSSKKKKSSNSNKEKNNNATHIPDNAKLVKLINDYVQNNKSESYSNIIAELEEGDANLLLPIYNQTNTHISTWAPSPEGYSIKPGIYFVDGLATVAAFTNKKTLFAWAKKPTPYIELFSKTIIEICEENEVKKIIIDGKLSIMLSSKNE